MKKIISVLLSAILMFSLIGTGFSAYAASGDTLTVTVSGTQNNELVKKSLDKLNDLRTINSAEELEFDKQLTAQAQNLAIKSMLFFSNDFSLPDGSTIYTVIPEYNNTTFVFATKITELSVDKIVECYGDLSKLPTVKSIGVALFTSSNSSVLYVVYSTVPAGEQETNFNNSIITSKEKVLIGNLSQGIIDFEAIKNGKYALSMRVTGSGFSSEYFNASNADIAYRSSNSKIFKIIGSNGYVKKNGTVTITSYSKSGSLLIQGKLPCTASTVKPTITKLTAKKKALTLKWTKNIANASGYQIQYSTKKNFKNAKSVTVKGKKNVSKTIKKLKSGKKYYVRVRAYVNQGEGEKLYTPWSAKKSVKVK